MLAFEILPQLRQEVDSEWLAKPFDEHLAQTRAHPERVESVFLSLGVEPSSNASAALEGLKREHDELAPKLVEPRLKDIFLASAAAKTEHLELAVYSSLLLLAEQLELDGEALRRNLEDEEHALREVEHAASRLRERLPT